MTPLKVSITALLALLCHAATAADAPIAPEQIALFREMPEATQAREVVKLVHLLPAAEATTLLETLAKAEIPLRPVFEQWAEVNIKSALLCAERVDGFLDSQCRIGVFRSLARRNPMAAAKMMRALLDPLNHTYYYHVMMDALMPELAKQPALTILRVLPELTSHSEMDDRFRDAIYELPDAWPPPSQDWRQDWLKLSAEPPSYVRDLLLGKLLAAGIRRDLARAVEMDLSTVADADPYLLNFCLQDGWPRDPEPVLPLVPAAHETMLKSWIGVCVWAKKPPDWPLWMTKVLGGPASTRLQAFGKLLPLWLKHDEKAAREWISGISPAAVDARSLAASEIDVVDLVQQAKTDFPEAVRMASAFTSGPQRTRCLREIFAQAGDQDRATVEAAVAATREDLTLQHEWLDAWALNRMDKEPPGMEQLKLALRLHNRRLRETQLRWRAGSFGVDLPLYRELLQHSPLSDAEKEACLQARFAEIAWLQGENPATAAAALATTQNITNPEIRFMRQRHIVHEAARENLARAKALIEATALPEAEKQALLQEWQKVLLWHRRP